MGNGWGGGAKWGLVGRGVARWGKVWHCCGLAAWQAEVSQTSSLTMLVVLIVFAYFSTPLSWLDVLYCNRCANGSLVRPLIVGLNIVICVVRFVCIFSVCLCICMLGNEDWLPSRSRDQLAYEPDLANLVDRPEKLSN